MKLKKVANICGTGLIFLLFVLFPGLTGCGKKGPPIAPMQIPMPVVSNLTAEVKNDRVTLWWSLPKSGGQKSDVTAGFFVSRSKTALKDADCEDCPLLFQRVADIPLAGASPDKTESARWTHEEGVEKGFRYIYKVTVYNKDGDEGPDSNPAEFIY